LPIGRIGTSDVGRRGCRFRLGHPQGPRTIPGAGRDRIESSAALK
jgi:hypothetical protein